MIDIDIIVKNIEAKIKSLEQLNFDDEPKNFLYTPIKAITITNTTDFRQLECQKFVRCNQKKVNKNLNESKYLTNQNNVNQEGGSVKSKESARFSRSYTEFLSSLNSDMRKFKEQQKKNQSCDNFLGKSAKIFVQNENSGSENKCDDADKSIDLSSSSDEILNKIQISKQKESIQTTKSVKQVLKNGNGIDVKNQGLDVKKSELSPKNQIASIKNFYENKKIGKIIKNPNPSTFKPKSETRTVGKILSRRMTIDNNGWGQIDALNQIQVSSKSAKILKLTQNQAQNSNKKELSLNKNQSEGSGSKISENVNTFSKQHQKVFKVPSNVSSLKPDISRRVSISSGTKLMTLREYKLSRMILQSGNVREVRIGINETGNIQEMNNSGEKSVSDRKNEFHGSKNVKSETNVKHQGSERKLGQTAENLGFSSQLSQQFGAENSFGPKIENFEQNSKNSEQVGQKIPSSDEKYVEAVKLNIPNPNDNSNSSKKQSSFNEVQASENSNLNLYSPNQSEYLKIDMSRSETENFNTRSGKRKRQMNPKYNESEYLLKNTSREFTNAIRSKMSLNKLQKVPGRKNSLRAEQSLDKSEDQSSIKNENFEDNSILKIADIKSEPIDVDPIDIQHSSSSFPSPEPYNRPKSKEIQCKICHKFFSKTVSLTRHMLLHSGERRCICPQCNYRFSQKSDLQRHMVIHDDDSPSIPCTKCDKLFRSTKSLRRHALTHEGKCEYCNLKFKTLKILKYHILEHHRGKIYECGICGDKFPVKYFLSSHMKTHAYDDDIGGQFFNKDDIEEQLFSMESPKVEEHTESSAVKVLRD